MRPVQTLPIFSYGGVVDQAVNRDPGGWGQVHILVNDGAGLTQEVSLAPEWYLQFQGCLVQRGQHVTGEGFHFDSVNRGGLLYAKNVIVNGVALSAEISRRIGVVVGPTALSCVQR